MTRQRAYQIAMVQKREDWYLRVGPSKDQWRSMSPAQQAVHRRWYDWYRKRRTLRELLLSSPAPSRLPLASDPSPPSRKPAPDRVGAHPRKPLDLKGLNHGQDPDPRIPQVPKPLYRGLESKPLGVKGEPKPKRKSKGRK